MAKEAVETEEVTFGVAELIEEIQKETGKEYQPASIRVILRGLVKSGALEKSEGRWKLTQDQVDVVVDHVAKTPSEDPEAETVADEEEAAPAKKAPAKKAKKAPAKKKKEEPVIEEGEDELSDDDELDLEDL